MDRCPAEPTGSIEPNQSMQALTSPSRHPMHATYDQRMLNQIGRLLRPPMVGAPPAGPPPGPDGFNGTSLGPNRAPTSSQGPCEAHGRATHMARPIGLDVHHEPAYFPSFKGHNRLP
ncbi:hypothetical protein F511_20889 [Dorcoceras hygrometricum]|uniref:Uncharacterized protein n=1 Tax=Dorcoceras hygrometricum TaxID=472368 RepID=A0A2Z7BDJ8_9LAMI|nr:hypothetical protein F511_20889 [Dorcoceras hygrometricum]